MKSHTDIQQSEKLAEILPIESADMGWYYSKDPHAARNQMWLGTKVEGSDIPAWSLTALLDVLDKTAYFMDEDASVYLSSYKTIEWYLGINNSDLEVITKPNPIDACYEMILKLHEKGLL